MKTATIRVLRNQFARVSAWLEQGESVQITKRGKPFARVVPEPKPRRFLGETPGTVRLPDDLDAPPPATWKVRPMV